MKNIFSPVLPPDTLLLCSHWLGAEDMPLDENLDEDEGPLPQGIVFFFHYGQMTYTPFRSVSLVWGRYINARVTARVQSLYVGRNHLLALLLTVYILWNCWNQTQGVSRH